LRPTPAYRWVWTSVMLFAHASSPMLYNQFTISVEVVEPLKQNWFATWTETSHRFEDLNRSRSVGRRLPTNDLQRTITVRYLQYPHSLRPPQVIECKDRSAVTVFFSRISRQLGRQLRFEKGQRVRRQLI
jgi:hypothetical protein